MCAPASVTALHSVVSISAYQAYMLSHVMGVFGLVGASLLCFKSSIVGRLSRIFGK